MAAVGSGRRPNLVLPAARSVFGDRGRVFAIIVAARRGVLAATLQDTSRLVTSPAAVIPAIESPSRANRFAYGPAIAVGTLVP